MSYMELVESSIFWNISAFVHYDNIIQRILRKIHLAIMFTFAKGVIYHVLKIYSAWRLHLEATFLSIPHPDEELEW
jgi:hypothetical protein